jgi:Uma2 family endonuclease
MIGNATLEDLYRVKGKVEVKDGRMVTMPPAERGPGRACGAIIASLFAYEETTENGEAFMGNTAFVTYMPSLRTFSPDAAYFWGTPTSAPGKFINGAPIFAAEVRSEGDYGPSAEREMAEKRADYFKAGTLVVWDVDVLKEMVVRVYRSSDRTDPTLYGKGELAEAEPALPGWTMAVDDLLQ